MPHIAIVGAGLSGLALAYRLKCFQPELTITILEQASRPGGNIWTERIEGFLVEGGPNGFLDSNPSTLQLCRDLGLADRLLAASESSRKNRYLFVNGGLRKLPGSLGSFLTNGFLSWRGKVQLLLEKYRRRPADVPADESVHDFACRRAGREVAEVLADAMVTGIHGGDPRLLSINAAFPRVVKFERQFGSVTRGFAQARRQRAAAARARGEQPGPVRMWSFREGLCELIEGLRDQCGARILYGVGVRRIRRDVKWIVESDGADRLEADAVVLTCQAPRQAAQLADLDPSLARQIAEIPYAGIAVVALGFRRTDVRCSQDGFGYIAPQSTRRDVLGVQWCSSIFPDRAPPGMVLWRALCGGWNRPDLVAWEDGRLLAAVRAELRLTMGVEADPEFVRVIRWPRAIPQYTLGHVERVAQIEARLKNHVGLFLGGNAYHGVAMNDCVEQAELLGRRIVEYLG